MKISLVTGCTDPHYQLDLTLGLINAGVEVEVVGGDTMEKSIIWNNPKAILINLRGDQNSNSSLFKKIVRIVKYYILLLNYAHRTNSQVFHIQWPNKFTFFDRTILNSYYKILGKKLIHTAHNINSGERDGNDNFLNRLSLKYMYGIMDHIIVHTNKMKEQLIEQFNVDGPKISVIPHGLNNRILITELEENQARNLLDLGDSDKVMLFFGNIVSYKGLEYIIEAFRKLRCKGFNELKLIIAGKATGQEKYLKTVQNRIQEYHLENSIIEKIQFIPDEEIEIYFKAADVVLLPYRRIFQSGVIFVSYAFGLPVIATDVGSLKEDIIEGVTGFVAKPEDSDDLGKKIEDYFSSDLYKNLKSLKSTIINYAKEKYSWDKIGEKTLEIYEKTIRESNPLQ